MNGTGIFSYLLLLNNPVNVGQNTSSIDPMGIQGCHFFRNKASHSLGKLQQTNGSRHVKRKKTTAIKEG